MTFTQEQLEAAFKKVQNADHWKNPIDAVIDTADIDVTRAAIQHFTGTQAEFKLCIGQHGKWRVEAEGYRAGPAGDH